MKQLPSRPSLEYLRKEAKQLLAQARTGEPSALALLKTVTTSGRPSLHHAQLALAREYGCSSWRDLTVKVRTTETDSFLEIVCGDRWDLVKRLRMPPETVRLGNIYVAAACGDIDSVEHLLQRDRRRAREKGGPGSRTALSYLCFSQWNKGRETVYAECARILLEAGADPNTSWIHPSYPDSPLSALYGAAGLIRNPELVEVLLEFGAEVNDGESLYHSMESRDHTCLKLLLDQNPRWEKSNAHLRMLDYEDLEGLRLILDAGAPLNEPGTEGLLNHAIRRSRSRKHIELLLDRGADPTVKSSEGLTPFANALRHANLDAAEVLKERGLADEETPAQKFLGACLRGDLESAKTTNINPQDLKPTYKDAFVEAAWNGRFNIVRTMLELGFPVDHQITHGGYTALHAACWKGYHSIVDLLLEHGARVDIVESSYKAPPMGWAMHGSLYARADDAYFNPGADYAHIVRRLVEYKAPMPEHVEGSPEVLAALES